MSDTKTFKLIYFGIHGRALPIRLAAAIGKVDYENVYLTFETWPQHKARLGALPVAELPDGTLLPQSSAILTWVGRQGGLVPADALEAARVDAVLGAVEDLYHLFTPSFREKDQEKKLAARKELADGAAKDALARLDGQFAGGADFIVSNKLSVADLKIFAFLQFIVGGKCDGIEASWVDQFAALKRSYNAVAALEQVKEHVANPGF
jgi:glutathione S-transferase